LACGRAGGGCRGGRGGRGGAGVTRRLRPAQPAFVDLRRVFQNTRRRGGGQRGLQVAGVSSSVRDLQQIAPPSRSPAKTIPLVYIGWPRIAKSRLVRVGFECGVALEQPFQHTSHESNMSLNILMNLMLSCALRFVGMDRPGATDNGTGTMKWPMERCCILSRLYPIRSARSLCCTLGERRSMVERSQNADAEDHPEMVEGVASGRQSGTTETGRCNRCQRFGLPYNRTGIAVDWEHIADFYNRQPESTMRCRGRHRQMLRGTRLVEQLERSSRAFGSPPLVFCAIGLELQHSTCHSHPRHGTQGWLDDLKHNATLAAMSRTSHLEDPTFCEAYRSTVPNPQTRQRMAGRLRKDARKNEPRV